MLKKVSSFAIGDTVTDCVFCLKSLHKSGNGGYSAVLSDKESEISAVLMEERYEKFMSDLVGGAVTVNGVVLNGTDMTPYIKIKSMVKAESGSYKPSDLFQGLDEKLTTMYMGEIRKLIEKIPSKECKALCNAILTDEKLFMLAAMPASVGYHGRFAGGALATTASVANMAVQAGTQYHKLCHGLYGKAGINWSVLATAALLHAIAVGEYYQHEQPYERTEIGLNRGYFSLLQKEIENAVKDNGIPLDDLTLARILNVLGCAVNMKTSVKATSPEGILFRHILMAYEDLDMLAEDRAAHEEQEGESMFFSSRSRRYVVVNGEETPVTEQKGA